MNGTIQQFHNVEFGAIEILLIDGKPYFPAVECAKILGYSNPRDAVSRHCRCVVKRDTPHPQSQYRLMERSFIPEGDLYRLIIRSKLPAAERFEKWVFDEVLPSIRKHGAYMTNEAMDAVDKEPGFIERLIGALRGERAKNTVLQEHLVEIAPKARYCERILQTANTVPIGLIAKDYGMSAVTFNKLLHGLHIQYRLGGTWVLFQKYAGLGYTKTYTYRATPNTSSMQTNWTQKGRLFLYGLLKEYGILPKLENGDDFC